MAQSKRHGHERRPDRGREHEHEGEGEGDHEDGDDPNRHASIIERRWLGSPLPTLELYARALRQWQALPGAVARSATQVTTGAEPVQTDTPVPGEKE